MSSGWGVYTIIILSAVVAFGVTGVFRAVLRPSQTKTDELKGTKEILKGHQALSDRTNTRYFFPAQAAIGFVVMLSLLIPLGIGFAPTLNRGQGPAARTFILLVSLGLWSFITVLYFIRRKDLDWEDRSEAIKK